MSDIGTGFKGFGSFLNIQISKYLELNKEFIEFEIRKIAHIYSKNGQRKSFNIQEEELCLISINNTTKRPVHVLDIITT